MATTGLDKVAAPDLIFQTPHHETPVVPKARTLGDARHIAKSPMKDGQC